MKISIPIELVQELQSYEEIKEERESCINCFEEEMKRIQLCIVSNTERRKERNISYVEEHDWHIYKGGDWIQEIEERDWL